MANFSITVDHAQRRINGNRDRLSVTMAGKELDSDDFSNTWIDPITHTLMMRPAPLYSGFWTSDSGIYAKPGSGDLEFSSITAMDWVGHTRFSGAGSVWKTATSGAWYRLSSALSKNRGVYVGWHQYSAGDNFLNFTCGWSSTTDTSAGLVLEFYSQGQVVIYKDGVAIQSIDLKFTNEDWNWLLLIPGRRRELLIVTEGIGGERIVFADITETDASPTIAPAQKFFIKNGTGSLDAQIAPLKFNSSGYLTSSQTSFSEAPDALDSLVTWDNETWAGGSAQDYRLFGHEPYAGTVSASVSLRNSDDSGAFVNNGTNQIVRPRVTISSDGSYTPFVYAVHAAYAGDVVETDDSEQFDDLIQYAQGPRVEIGDDNSGASLTFTLRSLATVEASVSEIHHQINRPGLLQLGSVNVLDGILSPEVYSPEAWSESDTLTFRMRDYWALLEEYMFVDRIPLDGLTWVDAVRLVLGAIGWDVSETSTGQGPAIDITDPATTISSIPAEDAGTFGLVIQAGDTAAKWIHQLMGDYASTWEYGFRPTSAGIKFYAKSQTDLGTTAFVTLYPTIAAAITAGYSAADAPKWVYRDYQETQVEPEGNDVRVTGQDMRTRRPIQSFKRDTASITVDTAPSSRPDNWRGFPSRVGLVAPALNTQTEVDYGATEIYDRVTPVQYHCEFTCFWPDVSGVPLWRSHNVTLLDRGTFRVTSLVGDVVSEISSTQYHRTAHVSARFLQ